MPKVRRKGGGVGRPFQLGVDKRRHSSGRPSVLQEDEICRKKRWDMEFIQQALQNEGLKCARDLPGLSLRPLRKADVAADKDSTDSSNDVIDLDLLNGAHSDALNQHRDHVLRPCRRPPTRHDVKLRVEKVANMGFGVSVRFACHGRGCRFKSTVKKLYISTPSGGCVTNAQAGLALSKIFIKSSEALFLFSSLNLNAPSQTTLQKHLSQSCTSSQKVLDESLSTNRAQVHDYLNLVSRFDDPSCPSVSVQLDGQYNRPIYHGFDGRSTSVSEPVVENETKMNLLISHAVVSKLDGSYDQDKVRVTEFLDSLLAKLLLFRHHPLASTSME